MPDTSRGVIRITDVTDPALLVFEPPSDLKNGASVIIAPGGAYQYLAVNIEGHEIAAWLNSLGITAFVLEYRVPQKQEEALWDMHRAIRLLRAKSDEFMLDASKIGVMGFSAGGNLSAKAGVLFDQETYPKQDTIDVESARPDFALLIYPAYLADGENQAITPELAHIQNSPPMFIFTTADDPYSTTSALIFGKKLADINADVELHMLPKGGHGYGLRTGNPAAEVWPGLAQKWLMNFLLN